MQRTNRHHLLPRSKGGENSGPNIKRLEINKHMDWHSVFSNKTPLEQIEKIIDMNYPVLTERFKQYIYYVLSEFGGGKAYKQEAIKTKEKISDVFTKYDYDYMESYK